MIDRTESQVPPNELVPLPKSPPHEEPSIASIIAQGVQEKMPVETMQKLMELYERMNAVSARKQFTEAMSGFRAECPPIPRRTENTQFSVTRNGVKSNRKYASLEDIEATIREPLGKHGLSFRWGDMTVTGTTMTLACIVSHVGGHSESSSVAMPVESRAGCSEQQKYGAAMTYAQRFSLIQALGLTSCDEDTDGNENPEKITESQAANLQAALDSLSGDAKKRATTLAGFLKFMDVERLSDIRLSRYGEAVAAIEKKRKQEAAP